MYLHHSGDQNDSFCKDEISGSSTKFVEMTRPTRPPDYGEFRKQDGRPSVFPFRRAAAPKVCSPSAGKESYDISLDEIDLGSDIKSNLRSLNEMFGLDRPSVRSVFYTLLIDVVS
jgi:hypothetical protein